MFQSNKIQELCQMTFEGVKYEIFLVLMVIKSSINAWTLRERVGLHKLDEYCLSGDNNDS
jgi:hypothetical protein